MDSSTTSMHITSVTAHTPSIPPSKNQLPSRPSSSSMPPAPARPPRDRRAQVESRLLARGGSRERCLPWAKSMRVSKNMQNIVEGEGRRRGIARPENGDLGAFSHVIIKNAWEDQRLYLVAIAKRLQYCMPVHAEAAAAHEDAGA